MRIMIEYHALSDRLDDLLIEVEALIDRLMEAALQPMPGLLELLDELERKGIRKAVATSGTRQYADNVLSRLGIGHRFEFILTAEDIVKGKPNPDVYLLAAERLGLAPPAMMVLEDSANGCCAGIAAGAFTVAVPNRHTRLHSFDGVQFVAHTLADPRILLSLQNNR
jgi:HAD superfamily hydrolase (TIGR01509 family)